MGVLDRLDDTVAGDPAALATLAAAPAERSTAPDRGLGRGATIGRYILLERLGAGGMGVVYAAFDPQLDRKVALKLLLAPPSDDAHALPRQVHARGEGAAGSEGAAMDPASARLLREAQSLARLDHPHVVTVHDVGTHHGRVFIAMEFVRGKTLGATLRSQPRDWREVVDRMLAAARGLAAAHAVDLVHRDFKPDNVMVGDDGRVRVMDFGLARSERARTPDPSAHAQPPGAPAGNEATFGVAADAAQDAGASAVDDTVAITVSQAPSGEAWDALTAAGAVMGTPAYMAPEQFRSAEVGPLADQFAFSVTFWEALYGERPFAGASFPALASAICGGRMRAPPPGARVPMWLRRVVTRGLAVDPAARWPSMNALIAAIQGQAARATRRRVAVVGISAITLGLMIALGARVSHARAVEACIAEGAVIAQTWDTSRREQLEHAMKETGASYAATSLARVTPWLDEWADAWARARAEVCMHASVAEDWPAEIVARASECLEERHLAFRAVVDALTEVDATSIIGAIAGAAELPDVASCTDRGALARRLPLPTSDLARIEALRAKIARAHARFGAGEYARALDLADEAVALADTIGWAPIRARARIIQGSARDRGGDPLGAATALSDAYFIAAEVDDVEAAADAATSAMFVFGTRLAKFEEADAWSQHARIALIRIDEFESATIRKARWSNRAGLIARAAGRHDEAIKLHEASVAIYERIFGRTHPSVAAALGNLALAYEAHGDVERAVTLSHEARALEIAVFGDEHPEVAISTGNLGMLLDRAGRRDDALAHLEQAREAAERSLSPAHPEVARILHNLADVRSNLGQDDEARPLYERALAIRLDALGPEHPDVASTLTGLGIVAYRRGDFVGARDLYAQAHAIQESALGATHPDVARGLVNLGNATREAGETGDSLAHYGRALAILEPSLGPEDPEIAFVLRNLGLAQERLGDGVTARSSYERALAIRVRAFGDDDLSTVALRRSLAALAEKEGEFGRAAAHLAHVLAIRSAQGDDAYTLAPLRLALARLLIAAEQTAAADRGAVLAEHANPEATSGPDVLLQQARAGLSSSDSVEDRARLREIDALLAGRARRRASPR